MAPTTPVVGVALPSTSPVGGRQQPTLRVALTSTPNTAASSSSTPKIITSSISSHAAHVPASSTATEKSSTAGLSSTTRLSTVSRRTTTRKPISASLSSLPSTNNVPNVPTTSAAAPSTTRRTPHFSAFSPGGNHPNYSTILPPISQGQHGAASSDGNGANTSTIIAGVIVPLVLIGIVGVAVYYWYRRKYPVRMLGRDFNRFSNPAYNKRASTVTLVKNDEQKDWDTLCRRNPDLSVINEDAPDGVDNQAFEYENEDDKGVNSDIKVESDSKTSTTGDIENRFEEETIQNEGIRRERPKTKRAVLVKTSTMDDFENGFELVTESDLGQRTESEVSSGNDSTETHTISLTFSETFDDRHKTDRSYSDMSEVKDTVVTNVENNDLVGTEDSNLKFTPGENVGECTAEQNSNVLDENDMSFSQSNESFEVISDKQETDKPQEGQDGTENKINKLQITTDELGSGNKSETQVYAEGREESRNLDEMKFIEHSNTISPTTNFGETSDGKTNDIEHHEDIQHTNTSVVTEVDEKVGVSIHQGDGETEQEQLDKLRHDTNFDGLSHHEEDKVMNITKSTEERENEVSVLEKEKTEVLEKDKISVEFNELQTHGFTNIEKPDGCDSQNEIAQRKLPSLHLSNENIVLDSDPKSPTLVQESFILENESQLPVYLDSTHMSPRRGRRAFTLNDIASEYTTDVSAKSEFSLPKLNDEKSKSSPVISEMKNPNFTFKQFEFESKRDDANQSKGGHPENTERENLKTYAGESEEQKQFSSFNELTETRTLIDKSESQPVSSSFDTTGYLEERYSKKDFSEENDEHIKTLDDNFSDFSHNKSGYFNVDNNLENNNFGDFITDSSNLVNADSKSGDGESTQQTVNDADLDSLNFLNVADIVMTNNNHAQDNASKEIIIDEKITEDNPFLENFPQSSTPTASFVMGETPEQNNETTRKKLLPQSFDFDNFDDSDGESSSFEKSSENSENLDSPLTAGILVKSVETFDKVNDDGDPIEDNNGQQPVESLEPQDFLLTRSTDSSTALSWEVLSRENSQDSRSTDHLDLTTESSKENVQALLEVHDNKNENNGAISLTNSGAIDFSFPDVSKQISAHDTSIGSSATTDLSWELVNEEGDNSEC